MTDIPITLNGDIFFYPGGYSETEIIFVYGVCRFARKIGHLPTITFDQPPDKGMSTGRPP